MADPNLPAGWETYFDDDNYPYYYNAETGESTYDYPGAAPDTAAVDPGAAAAADAAAYDDGGGGGGGGAAAEEEWPRPVKVSRDT